MAVKTEIDWNEKLLEAAKDGELAGVIEALDNGAEINAKNEEDLTALHIAAWNGCTDILRELLQATNVDINVKDNNGNTPLYLASKEAVTQTVMAIPHKRGVSLSH